MKISGVATVSTIHVEVVVRTANHEAHTVKEPWVRRRSVNMQTIEDAKKWIYRYTPHNWKNCEWRICRGEEILRVNIGDRWYKPE